MIHNMNHALFSLATASVELLFIEVSAHQARAWARVGRIAFRGLYTAVCVKSWPYQGSLFALFRRLSQTISCFRALQTQRLQREQLARKAPSQKTSLAADEEQYGGDRISFATWGSHMSLCLTVFMTRCLTKAATGVIKLCLLTIFLTNICMKMSERDKPLKLWLSVSFSAQ